MLKLTITPRDSLAGYDRIDIDLPDVRVGNVRCRFMGEKMILYSIPLLSKIAETTVTEP